MFSSKEKKNGAPTQSGFSSSVNSIGEGTYVEGSINASSDIRIDGEIKGNLICQGKLILGERGKIVGEIECANALIEGEIRGKVVVSGLLQAKETAIIEGEIYADKLDVNSGAVVNGSCSMGQVPTMTTVTDSVLSEEAA